MNVEIGTEADQFLFWEYINRIFFAVCLVRPKVTVCMELILAAGSEWGLTPEPAVKSCLNLAHEPLVLNPSLAHEPLVLNPSLAHEPHCLKTVLKFK